MDYVSLSPSPSLSLSLSLSLTHAHAQTHLYTHTQTYTHTITHTHTHHRHTYAYTHSHTQTHTLTYMAIERGDTMMNDVKVQLGEVQGQLRLSRENEQRLEAQLDSEMFDAESKSRALTTELRTEARKVHMRRRIHVI